MAVAAGMAIASTAVGLATGTIAAGTAIGSTLFAGGLFAAAAGHFLVTTALGAALNALAPKASASDVASGGYAATTTGTTLYHQVVYGRTYVSGVRVYDEATGSDNKYLHRVLVFAGHEIEEFEQFYINGLPVTNLESNGNVKTVDNTDDPDTPKGNYDGYVTIKTHLGSPNQAADADLIDASNGKWTSNHRLRGLAYAYIKLKYDADVFPSGIPEIGCVVKGKKVYDPRTETTAYSNNPALCIRDYLVNRTFGLKEREEAIDDERFKVAADVCEYYDYPDETGDPRYTCNGAFTTANTHESNLSAILASMGGLLWYSQGKWRVKPAYWTEPVLDLTADDLRSSLSVSTRHSLSDNFNTVKGTFIGEESYWETSEFTPVTNQDFIDADGGTEYEADLTFLFTDTSAEARRISNIYLERNRQQLTVSASFGMKAFLCQVGDNITLTYDRFGWDAKEFEVTSWTFGLTDNNDLQVEMTLREISESCFDDISDGDVYEKDNSTILSAFYVPDVGITVTSEASILKTGVSNTLVANITTNNPSAVDYVQVDYKKTSDTEWISLGTGPLGAFKALDLEVGDYDVRARAVNSLGVKGNYSWNYSTNINAFSDPPSEVDNFVFEVVGNTLNLSWDAAPSSDLVSYYKIRYSPDDTGGGSWAGSTTAVEKISAPSTSVTLPLRAGEYYIKAYNYSDVSSVTATSIIVPEEYLPSYTTTLTQQEDPTFSGTKTDTEVFSSNLIMSEPNPANDTGEYNFSTYIDTGSPRLVWARMICFNSRYDSGSGLFDDLVGDIDSMEGLWDEFGSNSPSADTTVEFFIRTTDDDPSGTPTWSDWRQFRAGNFYGRAFDFKVILKTYSEGITPSVSELKALVEYD